jgi:hypothetical protein
MLEPCDQHNNEKYYQAMEVKHDHYVGHPELEMHQTDI